MSENMNSRNSGNSENAEGTPRQEGKKGFNAWWEERSLPEKVLAIIGFSIAGIGFAALLGLGVMLLWNWLMPDIFGLKQVNYWQAWGLLVLSWVLFKGFGSNNNSSSRSTDKKRKEQLRRYMQESEGPAGED